MSWLFSQALVEEYSAACCADSAPCAPSSGNPTPPQCWWHGRTMDRCPLSRYGMTSGRLTEDRGAAVLTWYLGASRAKTSRLPERGQESTGSAAACGGRWRESSVRWDHATCSWRTHRCLWDEEVAASSVILPKWGMLCDGVLWERTTPGLPTTGNGSGFWPTPRASENDQGPAARQKWAESGSSFTGQGRGATLTTAVKMWPTPQARDHFPPHSAEYIEEKRAQGHGMGNLNDAVAHPRMFPTPCATDAKPITGGNLYVTETGTVRHMRPDGRSSNRGLEATVKMFPTPTSSMVTMEDMEQARHSGVSGKRPEYGKMFPPPHANCHTGPGQKGEGGDNLQTAVASESGNGGSLNPRWVEWLMGWPIGWVSLEPLETGRFRQWCASHGIPFGEGEGFTM